MFCSLDSIENKNFMFSMLPLEEVKIRTFSTKTRYHTIIFFLITQKCFKRSTILSKVFLTWQEKFLLQHKNILLSLGDREQKMFIDDHSQQSVSQRAYHSAKNVTGTKWEKCALYRPTLVWNLLLFLKRKCNEIFWSSNKILACVFLWFSPVFSLCLNARPKGHYCYSSQSSQW